MMKTKRIGVVMGGPSKEREVSLNTGSAIVEALKEKGYDAVPIDLDPSLFPSQIEDAGVKVVFNAVHGLYGEDGRLQAVLEMLGVPYTGSGVLSSAIAMNKFYTKRMFEANGVKTANCLYLTDKDRQTAKQDIIRKLGIPCVVKPAEQGSSIGVTIVKKEEDLDKALEEAFSYGKLVLAEAFFTGKEVAAGVMMVSSGNPIAMPLVLIEPHVDFYDYHNKYTKGATTYTCPAPFDECLTKALQEEAVKAYKALGCSGVARVDEMVDAEGNFICLEVNTIPGMTATSLVPKAAKAMGLSFPDLCEKILETAHLG